MPVLIFKTCEIDTARPTLQQYYRDFGDFGAIFVRILQNSLDISEMLNNVGSIESLFTTARPVMSITARTAVLSNLRNNRSLPQNLRDVIERFGYRQT